MLGLCALVQSSVNFADIFVRSPGDLLFFLGVLLFTQAGLFMALERRWRAPNDRSAERYVLAGISMTLAWALLMVGALFTLLSGQNAAIILPPLERAVQVVTLLLLGWAFLTADSDAWGRTPNVVLLGLIALVIAGYIVTGLQWPDIAPMTDFNLSRFGVAWTLIPGLIAAGGLVLTLMYFRRVADAPLKLLFFLLLVIGYGGTLVQMMQGSIVGNYAGLVRITFLAALPILPAVVYRLVVGSLQAEHLMLTEQNLQITQPGPAVAVAPQEQAQPVRDAGVERESAQLLRALGLILEKTSPADIPQQVVHAALAVLRADVGLLLRVQDANYADVVFAYDQALERPISALSINLENQPTLVNAIERRAQRPLYPDRNTEELHDLYTRLDIANIAPTYFQPLMHGDTLIAVLMVGMPYMRRELTEAERDRLKGLSVIASGLLALSFEANDARLRAEERTIEAMLQGVPLDAMSDVEAVAARQEMVASLELAREQIAALSQQVMQLRVELDYERSRMTSVLGDTEEGLTISQRMLALHEEQERLQTERNELLSRLQEAETALAGATGTTNEEVYSTMIEVLRREKDDLLAQRESLQKQLDDLRRGGQIPLPGAVQDVLVTMSNDKARLEVERDQLHARLSDIEVQLRSLGIENGPAGLIQLVGQLHEQRATLQARHDVLKRERDRLLAEHTRLEASIRQKEERDKQLQTLQTELKHVAGDRETAVKQRDQLRLERDQLLAKIEAIKENRARLLAEREGYRLELEEAHQTQAQIQLEKQQLADERSDLLSRIDRLEAERQALYNERDQLLARVEGDRDRLQQLGADGIGSLTGIIEDLTEQRNQLEHELNETRTALAALENRLEMLQVQVSAQQLQGGQSGGDRELIMGMVQELRTPLTSLVGYVDLLLSESAGILGEMQHKFLLRVSSNVSRLRTMLDELTRVAALDTGQYTLAPSPVDVIAVIEDAITRAGGHFREKNLMVHLNLAEDVPWFSADEDAVGQIMDQLLMNAYLASPVNGEIFITTRRQPTSLSRNGTREAVDSLFVAVEDRGGGIAPEDQARVFSRKYKAEHPLIEGLGDKGVGLALAKALVEAHGGILWLESRQGVGSSFNFVLPFEPALEVEH